MPTTPTRRRPGPRPSDASIVKAGIGLLVVFLVVGAALVAGSFRTHGDPGPGRPATRPPSALPTRAVTRTPSPSPSPSHSARAHRKPTAGSMRAFVRDYLATVTADPARGWGRLTPSFRTSSGGFSSYQRFWGGISRAEAHHIVADPKRRTVGYDVDYTHRDGSHTSDSTRLDVTYLDGSYLINGER